jgi:transposase
VERKDRIFKCNNCGFEIDRDLNASINLEELGTCCPEVKPVERRNLAATKQEITMFVSVS